MIQKISWVIMYQKIGLGMKKNASLHCNVYFIIWQWQFHHKLTRLEATTVLLMNIDSHKQNIWLSCKENYNSKEIVACNQKDSWNFGHNEERNFMLVILQSSLNLPASNYFYALLHKSGRIVWHNADEVEVFHWFLSCI